MNRIMNVPSFRPLRARLLISGLFLALAAPAMGQAVSVLKGHDSKQPVDVDADRIEVQDRQDRRSEEHTSEIQSLMRISYAVFCLQKITIKKQTTNNYRTPVQSPHISIIKRKEQTPYYQQTIRRH